MSATSARIRGRTFVTVLAVLAVSFGALLATSPRASATTYVRGWITVDTTWGIADTEYVLTGHVTVRPGATLTIVQGTTVKMDPGRALFVEGRLVAQGFPGNEVAFQQNNTVALFPPQGIQFNASSTGSVDRSTFDRFERPVSAVDSSPWIGSNYVGNAFYAFYLVRSNSWVWGNAIDRATVGIFASQSNAQILGNAVNGTGTGIQAGNGGAPLIADNVITNASGFLAIGVHVTNGATANLWRNTVYGVQGSRGANAIFAGNPGGGGGLALGILVDNAPAATVRDNVISAIYGGRGGDGAPNATGVGGQGGDGGPAAGIVVGGVPSVDMGGNIVTDVIAGRGGSGGGTLGTTTGGAGGDGGEAAGIEVLGVSATGFWYGNWINAITGGGGGSGGDGSGPDGKGGMGGDVFGIFTLDAMNGDASGNDVSNIRAGSGGNSTTGAGNGNGGLGGAAAGLAVNAAAGSSIVHTNSVWNVVGGDGGRGAIGGGGGNATGAYLLGKGDGNYNATSATSNWFQDIFGGGGAVGARSGGAGGTASGITVAQVSPFNGGNTMWNLQGGDGGDSLDGTDGGRGGDAVGETAYALSGGWSVGENVIFVTAGAAGAGPPTLASYAVGFYMEGGSGSATTFAIENATIAFVGTFDIWAGNFADGTTINTPFDPAKVGVEATATLTVKNYLAVDVYWPDGFTLVSGANVLVEEDGTPVWSVPAPAGQVVWLLTTDRVYKNSPTPTDVRNEVTVTYLAYGFANDPRTVDMAASNTQVFVMIDTDAPSSTAGPLPTYETSATFTVTYTAQDGNGVGLGNITLWSRKDGAGWTPYATQPAAPSGQFSFTGSGDGTYEFLTIADDLAGNTEPGPGNFNESWTILDTTRPGSRVAALPIWTTTQSFTVSWDADPGVTDIATYTVQFNRGFGWTNWLVGVTATSGTFTATQPWGVYEFRSIATDQAGNVETPPATNDTWTRIDMEPPASAVDPLGNYQTSLTFTVSWRFLFDNFDTASYRIDVRDNGGAWTTWIPSTTSTSASYTGVDAHLYEFRSIATDQAGNVETPPATNDTWTVVDVTEPRSLVNGLPTYTASTTVSLSWSPEAGVTDIATYTIQVSDNGGAWTTAPGLAGTTATTGTFAGVDGHAYAFRSLATDRAGNVEVAGATNDTWTVLDVTPPSSSASLSGTSGGAGWWVSAVMVTLTSVDATSGVDQIHYRVDGGAWQVYVGPFSVSGDGAHTVDYHGHDIAGLAEADRKANFNVDVSPPVTSASLSGTSGDNGWYVSPVSVSLTATDATSGVASTSYRLDGGAWTTYAGAIPITSDGSHVVDFYSTNNAGLLETAAAVSFRLDTSRPSVTNTAPRGAGTNTTPLIVITFNEPMNRGSVEAAFSITPDMNGAFMWSADNRTVTFSPDRVLFAGTDYFVAIDSSAKDMAGNTLSGPTTFSFTTQAAPPGGGTGGLGNYLWIIAVLLAGLGGALFIVMRRLGARAKPTPPAAAKPATEAAIDDVFLLYRDGILIKHETRRLKPDIDTDILSGMLTAVQSFVKDSFRSEEGELDELTFGEMHILIGRGKWLILAAMVQGDGTSDMRPQIEACIQDMELKHAEQIETWDGNMSIAKTLTPYVKKLIRGEYV